MSTRTIARDLDARGREGERERERERGRREVKEARASREREGGVGAREAKGRRRAGSFESSCIGPWVDVDDDGATRRVRARCFRGSAVVGGLPRRIARIR